MFAAPVVLVVAVVLATAPAARADDASPNVARPDVARSDVARANVRYERERITARFDAVPLTDAIQQIVTATGGDLRGGVRDPRDVTLELHGVPLEEALGRLLGAQNFTVRYGEGGRVKTIALEGGPEAPPKPKETPTAAGEPPKEGPAFPIVLSRMFMRHRPITLSEPLAERFGQEKASMPELLEIAMVDEDGISRALASQAVLSALEREGRYRRSFLRSLHQLDPDEMSGLAMGPGGARLVELLEFLSAHSREPTLQKKAGVVLEQMQDARRTDS